MDFKKEIVIGLTAAAKLKNWNVGKFAHYYYRGETPEPEIISNYPVWWKKDIKKWLPKKVKKNGG